MKDSTDADELRAIVTSAQEKSPDAWEQLYRLYRPRLVVYARRRLSSTAAAEDAVSEAFLRAIGGIDTFTWQGSGFVGWMYGITRNVVLESHRATTRDRDLGEKQARAVDMSDAAFDDAGDAVHARDERALLRRAFSSLDDADREILELRIVGELSAEEVGVLVDKKPGAVRMAQSRALERLRTALKAVQDA